MTTIDGYRVSFASGRTIKALARLTGRTEADLLAELRAERYAAAIVAEGRGGRVVGCCLYYLRHRRIDVTGVFGRPRVRAALLAALRPKLVGHGRGRARALADVPETDLPTLNLYKRCGWEVIDLARGAGPGGCDLIRFAAYAELMPD